MDKIIQTMHIGTLDSSSGLSLPTCLIIATRGHKCAVLYNVSLGKHMLYTQQVVHAPAVDASVFKTHCRTWRLVNFFKAWHKWRAPSAPIPLLFKLLM